MNANVRELRPYRLRHLCEETGLTERAVRLYERAGLLGEVARSGAGGWREYTPDQADKLRAIARMRRLNMPIEAMRLVLRVVWTKSLGVEAEGLERVREMLRTTRLHLDVIDLIVSALQERAQRYELRSPALAPATEVGVEPRRSAVVTRLRRSASASPSPEARPRPPAA